MRPGGSADRGSGSGQEATRGRENTVRRRVRVCGGGRVPRRQCRCQDLHTPHPTTQPAGERESRHRRGDSRGNTRGCFSLLFMYSDVATRTPETIPVPATLRHVPRWLRLLTAGMDGQDGPNRRNCITPTV